ncbi:MAG: hypothetical protein CMI59_09275 [Parvibaculum sp.]|nr:hypothetical protein [Parvibaculum sp.]
MRFGRWFWALWAVPAMVFWAATPAAAHPHVWIDMKVGIVTNADRQLEALRIHWTFDEFYSAFALDGIKKDENGHYPQKVLDELAQVNLTNLKEVDFFTEITANGKKLALAAAKDPESSWNEKQGRLTLTFTLPLKTPHAAPVQFRIYDPSYYISIDYPEKGRGIEFLNGPHRDCKISVVTPDVENVWLNLPEAAFTGNNATVGQGFGAHFASTATLACKKG